MLWPRNEYFTTFFFYTLLKWAVSGNIKFEYRSLTVEGFYKIFDLYFYDFIINC